MAASGDRAAAAGAALRRLLVALPGLLGLVLVSFGAWMAWPPAGPIVAGVLLLADRVASRWPLREGAP